VHFEEPSDYIFEILYWIIFGVNTLDILLQSYVRRGIYIGKYENVVDVVATLSILPLIWDIMKAMLDDDQSGYDYFVTTLSFCLPLYSPTLSRSPH
jgi:hypothetical protein